MPGDCGAWVVNANTGLLYGHIVAGDPVTGMAFIIPAHKVFSDIEHRFGVRPALSPEQPRAELTAARSYIGSAPFESSIGDIFKAAQTAIDLFKAIQTSMDWFKANHNDPVKELQSEIDQSKATLHMVQLAVERQIPIDKATALRARICSLSKIAVHLNRLIGLSLFGLRGSVRKRALLQATSWIGLYWYTAMISSVPLFHCGIHVLGDPLNSLLMGYLLLCHANIMFYDALAEAALDIRISRTSGLWQSLLFIDDYASPLSQDQSHIALIANSFTPNPPKVLGTTNGSVTQLCKRGSLPTSILMSMHLWVRSRQLLKFQREDHHCLL